MKRWNYMALAVCLAAATAACSGDQHANSAPANDAAVGTGGAATPGTPGDTAAAAARGDRDFVADMLADGQAEVELGKLAQQKARSKQVKDFAAMMVRDHTKAGNELKAAATQANIEVTGEKADHVDDHNDLREKLAKLSGAEFDREYMQAMVDDHEKAVNEAEDKANGSSSDEVKAWAAKTLPTLKKHLEQARQIDEALSKRAGT
jgi:putative membrane protein